MSAPVFLCAHRSPQNRKNCPEIEKIIPKTPVFYEQALFLRHFLPQWFENRVFPHKQAKKLNCKFFKILLIFL